MLHWSWLFFMVMDMSCCLCFTQYTCLVQQCRLCFALNARHLLPLCDIGRGDVPGNQVLCNGQGASWVCWPDGWNDWHYAVFIDTQVMCDGESGLWLDCRENLSHLCLWCVILHDTNLCHMCKVLQDMHELTHHELTHHDDKYYMHTIALQGDKQSTELQRWLVLICLECHVPSFCLWYLMNQIVRILVVSQGDKALCIDVCLPEGCSDPQLLQW